MADVAKLAGVSAMTVSRALRREASVSEQTRARVLEVIDEIGYVPDQAAGALSSGHSGLVAAIMPTLTIPMFGYVAQGLSDTLFQSGLQLFLGSSDYSADREEEILRSVLRRRPEAVVLAGVGHTSKASRLLAGAGIPVIEFLDGASPPIDHLVEIDPVAIGKAVMGHFKAKGRSKIGVVVARESVDRRSEARVAGLTDAARAAGFPDPVIIRHGAPSKPLDQGSRAAIQVVEDKIKVDAIAFMNDYAAIGALTTFRRFGVRVPEDIAVMGFGDCEVARHVTPALTTISFNPVAAGVEIGKIMLSALEASRMGKPRPPYRLTLQFHLVERDSA